MASARNEPECWVCQHFRRDSNIPICSLHKVRIPSETTAYFVCADFVHYSVPEITTDAVVGSNASPLQRGHLYTYHLMQSTPASDVGEFASLEMA